jgi:D-glycero-D-manno-heptose 1,7-bisphosphate phosphatase
MPGAQDAIQILADSGYKVFVLTNQSGIARGYYSDAEFRDLTEWALSELPVTAVLYCPHGPHSQCTCRKPAIGLVVRALVSFGLDASQSFLIGDKISDMECASSAGLRGCLYSGTNLEIFIEDLLGTSRKSC